MESEKVRFWQHLFLTLAELTELDVFLSMGWKESEPGVGSARLTIFKEWVEKANQNLDEQQACLPWRRLLTSMEKKHMGLSWLAVSGCG